MPYLMLRAACKLISFYSFCFFCGRKGNINITVHRLTSTECVAIQEVVKENGLSIVNVTVETTLMHD